MASLGFRPPRFSEDVAWLPCWLQNLRTDGSIEFQKESQVLSEEAVKVTAPSQENINALSREVGGYKNCHLFLSGENSGSVSFALSPANVFHFSLHLSSDVADSLFFPTQDLNASHEAEAPSEVLSLQPIQSSIDGRGKMHSMTDNHDCEQNALPSFIPEAMEKDASKSVIDTINPVSQQNEKVEAKCFKSDDISNAVELSIAASEALVIHDLVKMESDLKTICAEDVLEVALRVKQARLEGLDDGSHSSSEESDYGDSLFGLNDFDMEDAYEDIGLRLPFGVSIEEYVSNSAKSQGKTVSRAENYSGCNNKHNDGDLPSQLTHFGISEEKQLEVNVEMEMQQKTVVPLYSSSCDLEKHSDDPGLGLDTPKNFKNGLPTSHQFTQYNSNVLALNQTVGSAMADSTSIKPQNSVDSPLVETSRNSKKDNWEAYLAPERFRSRWLGGWTNKESGSSLLNQHNAGCIPKFFIRESSFLTESEDIAPDESSYVQNHDPKCAIGSQSSFPLDNSLYNKPNEGLLHSQDVVRCSSLSLIDPLCSVVPCSISSEHPDFKTDIDKEIDTGNCVPSFLELEDTFQMIPDKNVTFDFRHDEIIPVSKVVEQMPTRAEHTSRKQLSSLKTYSMVLPNQALSCNLEPLPTNQSVGGAVSLGTNISESFSALKGANGNENDENHGHFVECKSIIEITDDKGIDELTLKAAEASDILAQQTEEIRPPLILNNRGRRRLLGPKTVVNDISVEKHMKQHVVAEVALQHKQKKFSNLQVGGDEFHGEHSRVRKQVRFSEKVEELHPKRKFSKLEYSYKRCSSVRDKRQRVSKTLTTSKPHKEHSLTNCTSIVNEFLFHGIYFLLTGLSSQKERDMEALIGNSGGVVLPNIPSPPKSRAKKSSTSSHLQLPIVLCMKKLQTTKFLYGCAVGASILKVDWLTDSLATGTVLQPEKYMIFPKRNDMKWTRIGMVVNHRNHKHIFERVGIMLQGKHSFCSKLACIIKHGGGQLFKTLQWLVRSSDEGRTSVAAIVLEDKTMISRHLKSCALERGIPMMPYSWIIKSLYSGKLLPFTEENNSSPLPLIKVSEVPNSMDE